MDHLRGPRIIFEVEFQRSLLGVIEAKVRLADHELQDSYNLSNLLACCIVISEFPCHQAPFHFHYVEPRLLIQ